MARFENREEDMLLAMAQVIQENTGLALNSAYIKELLLEVQHEQLKGLVYKAFLTVNEEELNELKADDEEARQDG